MGDIGAAVGEAKGRWARLKRRRPSVRHLAEAWRLLERNRGNQFAAAITYFSFLALFPLLLLAVSVLGFVLHSHPAALHSLYDHIAEQVPGQFGDTLTTAINDAIAARTSVGIIGLAGVLVTGLGWIANLRSAIDAVWSRPPVQRNFFAAKARDSLVLAGLGLGSVVSIGLTVAGTSLTDQVLSAIGLDGVTGVRVLVKVLGLLLAVAGDVVIFAWLLVELPDVEVPKRIELRGALLAAVAFEVLKIVGSYTIAHTASSPTAGPFAGVLAVLIWIQLVARSLLFSCAWTAVVAAEDAGRRHGPVPEAQLREGARPRVEQPLVGAETRLLGRGAVIGAAVTWVLMRLRAQRAAARVRTSRRAP